MRKSYPQPNVGPSLGEQEIAYYGSVTVLLNGGSLSLLQREKMNKLEVCLGLPLESESRTRKKSVTLILKGKKRLPLGACVYCISMYSLFNLFWLSTR